MIYRKKITQGYLKKVRHNYSPKDSHLTDVRDCEYVHPTYRWICYNPFRKKSVQKQVQKG